MRWDVAGVQRVARLERHAWLRLAMLLATRGADGWGLIVIIPLAVIAWRERGVAVVALGAVSAPTTAVLVHWIKAHFRRKRPEGLTLGRPITAPDLHAFPSGHTAHAFGLLVLTLWLEPWLGLLYLPVALCVGVSRMVFGLHYPSDVVAGAFLGAAVALAAISMGEVTGFTDWIMRISPVT